MSIFTPVAGNQKNVVVRRDEYAGNLVVACPYSLFTEIGMINFYDDISGQVKLVSMGGTGSANIKLTPTGSNVGTTTPQIFPSASGALTATISGSVYNWSADGNYQNSLAISGSQNAGVISASTSGSFNPLGGAFVVEFFWKPIQVTMSQPPFNQFFFGTTSGDQILIDWSSVVGFRFSINAVAWNNAYPYASFYNRWNHMAFVRDGSGNKSIYLNGTRIANQTQVATVNQPDNGYWRMLGNSSGNNNDGAGKLIQDFRLYTGTNKGYAGTNITIPQSIVQYTN
jgi:hypothetical protein